MSARIYAVCNQKGGVGKTTVVTCLAEAYSHVLGKRVLVIDADPQGNSTAALGIIEPDLTLNDILYGDAENNQKIQPGVARAAIVDAGEGWSPDGHRDGAVPVHVIPAERELASRELDNMLARERRLRTAIKGLEQDYDVILIDCPPSLGLLTINALTASTHALLVSEPRVSSVEGLGMIVQTVDEVREHLNDGLEIAGVVVNKVRKNRSDQDHWIGRIREGFSDRVLTPSIPDRELYAKAQAASVPLSAYGAQGKVVRVDMVALAKSVLEAAEGRVLEGAK